jgi:hypothetical protein
MAKRFAVAVPVLLLAAFFGFVGWNKAFAPLAELARHGSWTVHLPEGLGRLVGWSEMALAAGLLAALAPRWRHLARIAAWLLIANQLAAAAVHYARGETAAMPQNAVLIAVLFVLAGALTPIPVLEEETA